LAFGGDDAPGMSMLRAQQKPAANEPTVDMQWPWKIPARDRVKLNATVFTPHGQKQPLRHLYVYTVRRDSYTDRAVYFAKHRLRYRGWWNVRGRGIPAAKFEPFVNEGRDGYDVVDGLRRSRIATANHDVGAVRMRDSTVWTVLEGVSAANLATIVPAAAAHPGVDSHFNTTFLRRTICMADYLPAGVTGNGSLFGNSGFWLRKRANVHVATRLFKILTNWRETLRRYFEKMGEARDTGRLLRCMVPSRTI